MQRVKKMLQFVHDEFGQECRPFSHLLRAQLRKDYNLADDILDMYCLMKEWSLRQLAIAVSILSDSEDDADFVNKILDAEDRLERES